MPHVAAYSYIALQEAILYTHYPSIYWNTACLIDDAGAFTEEDFPKLIERGFLTASKKYHEITNAVSLDDVKIETTPIDRDKIATSIAMFQDSVTITPPDINTSGFGFTLDEESNSIQVGLKVVSMLGNKLIYQILRGRPYESFDDFLLKTKIPKNRIVMLIKANSFRNIDSRSPLELLEYYVGTTADKKKKLNGMNINMLIDRELIPESLEHAKFAFNWWKYVRGTNKIRKGYIKLDEPAENFYRNNYDESKIEYFDNGLFVSHSYAKGLVDKTNNEIKEFIAQNHDSLLKELNDILFQEEWDKYSSENINDAEMESLRMYTGTHPLKGHGIQYDRLDSLIEDHFVGEFNIKGKRYPRYHIYKIIGTVVAKNKLKNMVTLLTPEGAIEVKMWQDLYTIYDKAATDVVDGKQVVKQGSFFTPGTHLVVFGQYRNGMIYPKVYKGRNGTGVEREIYKIDLSGAPNVEEKIV